MDKNVLELRIKQWIPLFEAQAKSGLNKQDWCEQNGIKRSAFFRMQRQCRSYLLNRDDQPKESTFVEVCLPENLESVNQEVNEVVYSDCPNLTSSAISVDYKGFSINLSGIVDEANLIKVLRAVRNAN